MVLNLAPATFLALAACLGTAGAMLAAAWLSLSEGRGRASRWLAAELAASGLWLVGLCGELSAPTLDDKFLWYRFSYLFSVFTAPLFLLVVGEVLGAHRWVRGWAAGAWLAFPLVNTAFAWTMREHDWLRSDFRLQEAHGLAWVVATKGPVAWFVLGGTYLASLVGAALLLRAVVRGDALVRRELGALLVAWLLPAAADLSVRFGWGPVQYLNLAPLALVPTFAVLLWMVRRYDTFELGTAGRARLLDRIGALVFVVDDAGRITELNQAAAAAVGRDGAALRGTSVSALGGLFTGGAQPICLSTPSGQRWLRQSTTPLEDAHRHLRGTLWVFDDVTAEREREEAARVVERLREAQRHARQLALLVRDLHDGVGGATASIALQAAVARGEAGGPQDAALRRIEAVARDGAAEIRSLLNALESQDHSWPSLVVDLRSHAASVLERGGVDFSFTVQGTPPDQSPELLSALSVTRLLKEALTNVLKHAQASRVDVLLHFEARSLEVTVRDHGRGLPPPTARGVGRGLRNMEARALELGGTFALRPVAPSGLEVSVALPLPLHAPGESAPAGAPT